jgi:methyltransferase-like protein/SAM-dependent methyltransferase
MQTIGLGATPNPYDQVPYPSLSYAPTHPDHLATMAILMGMPTAPAEHCRVLELGCAVGGNLLPMAYALPDSEFVGIDYSARQIAEGQAAVAALGLKNIAFRHLDILDVNRGLGQFDYIIAHGVYSWVPEAVRAKILAICAENLAPDGVAYVSYNTYPGWNLIKIVRELMTYRTRKIADPELRAHEARAVLDFFAQATADDNDAYSSFLSMYADVVAARTEEASGQDYALVLHDELEEINEPVYFHQFIERAEQRGLQYLTEADFSGMRGRSTGGINVPAPVSEGLSQIADGLIELEQYVDFMTNRTFRRTLLCHQEIELPRRLTADPVQALFAASRAKPATADPDLYSVSVVKFQVDDGPAISTDHPISKLALTCLAEQWPLMVPFETLLAQARARLAAQAPSDRGRATMQASDDGDVDRQVLAANLLTAFAHSNTLLELHSCQPAFVLNASERPLASAVARFQVQTDSRVTNLRHDRVTLDGFDRYLLCHLDGSHDRAALVDLLLAGPVADGVLTMEQDGEELEPPPCLSGPTPPCLPWRTGQGERYSAAPSMEDLLAEEVDRRLDSLAHLALLVS